MLSWGGRRIPYTGTKDTIELAQVLRDSIKEFSLKLNRNEADLLDTQSAIEKQVR